MKNLFKRLLLLFVLLMPFYAHASTNGYEITKYDVDMKVNEDNSFDIKENIVVNFTEAKHGIVRNIPLQNKIIREYKGDYKTYAKLLNLKINDKYKKSIDDSFYNIKIGDANKTVYGTKKYTISYKYQLSKDNLKDMDELYFNIIGDKWATISNVSFRITMPKSFDKSKLGFSTGDTESTGYNDFLEYKVDGNVITGKYNDTLSPNQAITVRLELPDNYFTFKEGFSLLTLVAFVVPIVFAVISVLLLKKYGIDDEVVETVEFYPPEGLNSCDVGFTFDGSCSDKSIISLLIYLADKGFLSIEEIPKKGLLGSASFKIKKLKDYDGEHEAEKLFMDGLFEGRNEVTKSDLQYKFYQTIDDIKDVYSDQNKKIYNSNNIIYQALILLFMILSYVALVIPSINIVGNITTNLIPLAVISFFGTLFFSVRKEKENGTIVNILIFIIDFIALYIFANLVLGEDYAIDKYYGFSKYSFAASFATMMLCIAFMPKRTKYGSEMLGKIRGFKNFLETAEKEKLESMVESNPNYFYNILPYTYALGISSKWIKKFESIAISPPNWYSGYDGDFTMVKFSNFMDNNIVQAQSAMTSSPSSSSSGGSGFSGGGFSGGGSGGGGGSSW